jgi:hypothetical protein
LVSPMTPKPSKVRTPNESMPAPTNRSSAIANWPKLLMVTWAQPRFPTVRSAAPARAVKLEPRPVMESVPVDKTSSPTNTLPPVTLITEPALIVTWPAPVSPMRKGAATLPPAPGGTGVTLPAEVTAALARCEVRASARSGSSTTRIRVGRCDAAVLGKLGCIFGSRSGFGAVDQLL